MIYFCSTLMMLIYSSTRLWESRANYLGIPSQQCEVSNSIFIYTTQKWSYIFVLMANHYLTFSTTLGYCLPQFIRMYMESFFKGGNLKYLTAVSNWKYPGADFWARFGKEEDKYPRTGSSATWQPYTGFVRIKRWSRVLLIGCLILSYIQWARFGQVHIRMQRSYP